jgi:2-hydroxy-3-oxopropionate reductase
MHIVLETAHEPGIALPGAVQVTQYLNALVGSDQGALDSSALVPVQERMCKLEILIG